MGFAGLAQGAPENYELQAVQAENPSRLRTSGQPIASMFRTLSQSITGRRGLRRSPVTMLEQWYLDNLGGC